MVSCLVTNARTYCHLEVSIYLYHDDNSMSQNVPIDECVDRASRGTAKRSVDLCDVSSPDELLEDRTVGTADVSILFYADVPIVVHNLMIRHNFQRSSFKR